jgi:hypothetical protein
MSPADSVSQQHGLDMPSIIDVVPSRIVDGTDIAGDYTENQLEISP